MKKIKLICISLLGLMGMVSCVNEWPNPEERTHNISFKVHCDTEWLPDYEMPYTRTDTPTEIQYQFRIFRKGTVSEPVKELTFYSYDFMRSDFTVDLSLSPGDYDLYVWSDICNSQGESLYYNSTDFGAITYLKPYEGDSNNKDAFRGMTSFTVEDSMYLNPTINVEIILKRPFARYIFVSTDFSEFIDYQQSQGKIKGVGSREGDFSTYADALSSELDRYTIKILYPLYMPAVFDNFTDKPFDSWTGVSFDSKITPINETEATLGLDYVMTGKSESGIQVAMEIYDENGTRIGATSTINIPTLTDRTTIVYGRFLTSNEDAGVTIDPNFKGQYNIQYK